MKGKWNVVETALNALTIVDEDGKTMCEIATDADNLTEAERERAQLIVEAVASYRVSEMAGLRRNGQD